MKKIDVKNSKVYPERQKNRDVLKENNIHLLGAVAQKIVEDIINADEN